MPVPPVVCGSLLRAYHRPAAVRMGRIAIIAYKPHQGKETQVSASIQPGIPIAFRACSRGSSRPPPASKPRDKSWPFTTPAGATAHPGPQGGARGQGAGHRNGGGSASPAPLACEPPADAALITVAQPVYFKSVSGAIVEVFEWKADEDVETARRDREVRSPPRPPPRWPCSHTTTQAPSSHSPRSQRTLVHLSHIVSA
jgi:hypothetical protein